MEIIKTTLPEKSILNSASKKYDFADSFQGLLIDEKDTVTINDIGMAFFSSRSSWIEKLFAVRNKIVSIFGLKTGGRIEDRDSLLKTFKCEKGDQMGLFKIFDKTENEIIIGEDDTHLDFRVSLLLEEMENQPSKKRVTVSTTVEFNNWFGRLYFLPVKQFHAFVVPTMLKGIITELEKKNVEKSIESL